ncbi:MAG: rRNA maturation RNase YbeY [Chitinophagaceae bacterium]|nr:rRNA maturation RNase YbeY [Chitinophagaceae bacterium]
MFYSLEMAAPLKRKKLLKGFIFHVFKTEKKKLAELSFIFCSDKFLLTLNQQYLGHNSYTDIITFDLSTTTQNIQAEVYISLDRVKENAKIFRTSISEELLRVIFHGVLHLCGYKDKSELNKKEMRAREDYYLRNYLRYVSRETRST